MLGILFYYRPLQRNLKTKIMQLNFKEIFTAFMVLFAVIDIVGNIPIIIDLRKKVGHLSKWKSFNNFWYNYDYFLVFRTKFIIINWYRCEQFCCCWSISFSFLLL